MERNTRQERRSKFGVERLVRIRRTSGKGKFRDGAGNNVGQPPLFAVWRRSEPDGRSNTP
jgi:hypothetical protein